MKRIFSFLIVALLLSFDATAQPGYTDINTGFNWIRIKGRAVHIPAGAAPALQPNQWTGAGALYVDSAGGGKGLYHYRDGAWIRLADTSERYNQVDVFLIAGQSNAVGNSGSPSSAPTPLSGTAFQFYNNAISAAIEPIGNSNGSAWPAFAVTYFKLTGRKICFVPAAVNGSSMASAANVGYGTWDTTGTLYATSVLKVDSALSALTTAGYTPIFKGVLWVQGETDADGINRGTISQATFSAAFAKLIKNYRVQFGKHISVNISRTGFRTDTIQTGYLQVQAAQVTLANPDSLTNIVFWNAPFFPQRGLHVDNYHYSQPGNNEMGRTMAENYINSTSNNFQYQAGNVYYKKGFVGIGDIIPASPLHIYKTGTARGVYLYDSLNDAVRMEIVNVNNGTLAGSGIRLHNSLGLRAHMVLLSQASSLESDALWIFNNGNVLLGSDNGILNFYTGGTATPLNAKLRIVAAGNIGIGNSVTPNASAQLDVQSTTRGLRIPTMTGAQMLAISSPATGLMVWCTDSSGICEYTGSEWLRVRSTGGGGGSGTVNSGVANRLAYYAASGTTVDDLPGMTANRAVATDASGLPVHANTTATELDYLSGVTSAVQTQLDNRWSLAGNAATSGTSFLGTTNNVSLNFRTNNTYRGRIDSTGRLDLGLVTTFTNWDGSGQSMISVKQLLNGIYGMTFMNAANDATQLSIGASGIGTNQSLAITAIGTSNYINASKFRIGDNSAASAKWHYAPGSATAGTAPEKKTSGTLLTTPEAGAEEFNGGFYKTTTALNRLGESGVILSNSASVSNSTTTVTTLSTYTTKANTLGATEEAIYFEYHGEIDDASPVSLVVSFAGTNIALFAPAGTATFWNITGKIVRTGASTATAMTTYEANNVTTPVLTKLTGLTFSGTNVLLLTGESTTGNTDAIVKEIARIKWEPAAAN